jgi:Mn-dependent DtxR family transcriptional regulator
MLYIANEMEIWKEFEANELTHSAAHHLLAIHELGLEYGGWARVSDIARQLGITRGSVSINLRALKKRGLVATDEHRMVKLSAKGLKIAHGVMAKKATVMAFLTDVLGVPSEQAEIDSCKVEHLISHPTSERLLHFVRFLISEDPAAQELLARFRDFHDRCPDSKTCEVCKGGQCLVEELQQTF